MEIELPLAYRWLKAHHFEGFTPWYMLEAEESEFVRREYQLESGQDIWPFARRQDQDDIAGFEIRKGQLSAKVLTVHLTWSSKLEREGIPSTWESADIFLWLKDFVIPATQEWMNEEDLESLLDENQ